MPRMLTAYLATLVAFCALDFVWLGFIAAGFYQASIGPLLLATPRWEAAIAFYLLYVAGVLIFCVYPALAAGSFRKALGLGALFGLFAYGTYDLSNLATLRGWSATVTLVDIVWGMAVTGLSATIGYGVTARYARTRRALRAM